MKAMRKILIILWSAIALVLLSVLLFFVIGGSPVGYDSGAAGGPLTLALDETLPVDALKNVLLDLSDEDVEIHLTDAPDIRVMHYKADSSQGRLEVRTSGDTLTIRRAADLRFRLYLNFLSQPNRVEVYLPRSFAPVLNIDMSSGQVEFFDAMQLSGLEIDMSSGKLLSGHVLEAPRASVDISSGSLELAALHSGSFSLDVSSGHVSIGELRGNAKVEVSSGNVRLARLELGDTLDIEVSSGKVEIGIAGNPSFTYLGKLTSGRVDTYFGTSGAEDRERTATVGDNPVKSIVTRVTSGSVEIAQVD